MDMKSGITVLLLLASVPVRAQNNPIFFGGAGDGYSRLAYSQLQTDTTLSRGGRGDGTGYNAYLQATATHNRGGAGDGFGTSSYLPAFFRLSRGGYGDGTSSSATAQPTADRLFYGGRADGNASSASSVPLADRIFYGGHGDGWNGSGSGAPVADRIFYGGTGDGWTGYALPLQPLPVSLLSFSGKQEGDVNMLYWTSADDRAADHYTVERSADARNFQTVGEVPSVKSGQAHAYNLPDKQPFTGNNFYRLKIVSGDGAFTYSNTVLLKRDGGTTLELYPNPAATLLFLSFKGADKVASGDVAVYDIAGRKVPVTVAQPHDGLLEFRIGGLPAGIYQIRISSNRGVMTSLRFVKN